MFNEYVEYDNIDNEMYDVYNLYLTASKSKSNTSEPPKESPPAPKSTPPSNAYDSTKKAAFTERFEQPTGSQPEYNALESCGDKCSEKKEDREMYEGYRSNRSCSHKTMSNRIMDFYDSISLSAYEIMMFIILVFFIIYIKQRVDRLEWAMIFVLSDKQNKQP